MFKRLFAALFVIGLAIGALPTHVNASNTVSLSDIEPGDLIRGQTFAAVYYYGKDGFRYVFPNDKTYFTWYTDFSTVKWLSDADLGKLQIGGNVTYKPGVKMIKINTDPKTYAVDENGSLRWVETEAAAIALYGTSWNTMIDDMPDGFFSNYTVTDDDITTGAEFVPSKAKTAATSIDVDKDLSPFTTIYVDDDGYSSDATIGVGDVVRWINTGSNKHTATADDLSWGSGTISPDGGFWQKRFNEADTYTFFCSYHSSMTGVIEVE